MLSQLENVKVKLGGLVMPVNGFGLHKRAQPPTSDELVALTRQYYLTAIELFGVERCMFESNFRLTGRVASTGCFGTPLRN